MAKDNEISITRVYDAPVKLVWEAWTEDKHVTKWWGPRGFTITTHSKDLRTGGHWSYTMHGPDGTDWPNKTLYHVVEKYQKLVYDHGGNEDVGRDPLFRVNVTFDEVKGKTVMVMTMAFESAEKAVEIGKFIKQAGGNATWDRLGEYLEGEQTHNDVFFINRSFDTDINTMFDMWTNPEHISRWLAPTGFSMKYFKADIKTGGESHYEMTNGKDVTMYGKAKYLEINKPNSMKYTQIFVDKDGKISRHPHAPTWPETMLTTVTFSEEGPSRTRVTVKWEVYGEATAAEREMFNKAKAGMTMGWTGSFDKLEAVLSK